MLVLTFRRNFDGRLQALDLGHIEEQVAVIVTAVASDGL